MDLNYILTWIVGISCGLSIVNLLRHRQLMWPRIIVPIAVAALLGTLMIWAPPVAGYYAGVAWLILMLLPVMGSDLVNLLLARKRYRAARYFAMLMAGLHPFDERRHAPRLIRALELMHDGETEAGLALLSKLHNAPGSLGRTAMIVRTRYTADWLGFLNWVADHPQRRRLLTDGAVLDGYLQGLGETGQHEKLLSEFQRLVLQQEIELPRMLLNLIRMKVAAFCGDVPLVEALMQGPLSRFQNDVKLYWTGTALQSAGEYELAAETLEPLVENSDRQLSVAAQRRLTSPVKAATDHSLHELQTATLQQVRSQLRQEQHGAVLTSAPQRRAWITGTLCGILTVVFVVIELPGGSEDMANLIRLGAMRVPESLNNGEWWRVFTAAFLHYGWLHYILNTLGLWLFGRRLEAAWGHLPTLVTYLLSAVGSIACAPIFMSSEPTILLGASGGIMGLIGGLLVHSGFGLWHGRSRVVSREFNLLFTIVVLQMIFDANTPGISSSAHLLGLGIGIACGVIWNLILLLRRVEARNAPARSPEPQRTHS